ncbi:MAG: YlxR family protein [Clostridia bacterium]|nr:YlxR family protein [Clostridia bacterium]
MLFMKHVPQRTCACCRKKLNKSNLLRIVKYQGQFDVDFEQKLNGRGAYFCGDDGCLKKLIKSRALDRAFKTKVPDEVYTRLLSSARKNSENK